MADPQAPRPRVIPASQAAVTQLPGTRPAPAPAEPRATAPPAPEQKRSKVERLHEARGYWAGVCHGLGMGICIGLFAMFLGFMAGAPILADYGARLDMTRTARDAALGGR